jgi:Bacterial extracellular solute-binding proteins, family 5 Middle
MPADRCSASSQAWRSTWAVSTSAAETLMSPLVGPRSSTPTRIPCRPTSSRTAIRRKVHIDYGSGVYHEWLNTRWAPFNDVRIRRALNFAVDCQALVDTIGGGESKDELPDTPPNFPGYEPYCPYSVHPSKGDRTTMRQLCEVQYVAGGELSATAATPRRCSGKVPAGYQPMRRPSTCNWQTNFIGRVAGRVTRPMVV